MSVVEKTGRSIEEAKRAALRELGIDEDDAYVEILSVPSSGFLGIFGKKDARVRVTRKLSAGVDADPPRRRIDMEEIAKKPLDPIDPVLPSAMSPADSPDEEHWKSAVHEKEPILEESRERSSHIGARHGGYRQGYVSEIKDNDRDYHERKSYRELTIDPVEPVKKGREFLEKIFASMGLDVRIEAEMRPNGALLNLFGENLGILIGKHGQTLDALQYLTNLAANQELTDERVRIVIDIEDYRMRREDTLRRLAGRLAEKVRRTRQRVVLEPMNRHERKIIHMALTDEHNILTYSAGDEPYRKVVIEPKHAGRTYRRSYDERGRGERYDRSDRYEKKDRNDLYDQEEQESYRKYE